MPAVPELGVGDAVSLMPGPVAVRDGFTLIEVVVAVLLVGIALLGMGAAVPTLIRTAGDSEISFLTLNAVEDRLQLILLDPRYAQLDSLYDDVVEDVPYLPGFERTTSIERTVTATENGRILDVTRITVTVDSEIHPLVVSRTVARAAP
ncbi:MAG TPA: prepilin-type N-terminal cleavage/methylation domain-containing protein [Longimicrobiales bacterium]|nr:prepilin-type N-terminal cleavage/methylation domain-containing protein [Longimicrobiales bacterium]